MDKCQFSEFTYGYCVTEDLVVGQGTQLTAAPVFPSLVEEGQPGVGYDVQLDRPGTPLFLQFKLVHQMVTGKAHEAKKNHFQPPFYRMHLRARKVSDQHASLISLEESGNDVFYVAPGFHTSVALDAAYGDHRVWERSFKIKPSSIGPLPDDKPHHVSFKDSRGPWRPYSETPSKGGEALSTLEIERILLGKIKERGNRNLREQLGELDNALLGIVSERNERRYERERMDINLLRERMDLIHRVAYLARQFFDCQFLFVTNKQ
jgi:hypothetical protein